MITKSESWALQRTKEMNIKHAEDYEYFVGCEEDK
jgi:hypothetical protein